MENKGRVINVYFEEFETSLRILSKNKDKADIIVNGDGTITLAAPEYAINALVDESVNILDNTVVDSVDNNIEYCISELLKKLGIPVHIKGYRYIRQAILLMLLNDKRNALLTKSIYPEVAEIMDTSSSKVERAIRHAIECAFKDKHTALFDKLFKYSIHVAKDKPTNGEFLVTLHDYCKNLHKDLIK